MVEPKLEGGCGLVLTLTQRPSGCQAEAAASWMLENIPSHSSSTACEGVWGVRAERTAR